MASKIDKTDAQEWLESLQQVGEGWYRQVALAIKAGAHKPLGLTQRQFAQQIGQKMIDPRPAIIEMHHEKTSIKRIANVLGMSEPRVHNLLVEAGEIKGEIRPTGGGRALSKKSEDSAAASLDEAEDGAAASSDEQVEALKAEAERLESEVTAAKNARKAEFERLRKQLTDLQTRFAAEHAERQRLQDEKDGITEQERDRAAKEAEAWAEEQKNAILRSMSHFVVASVVTGLEEATAGLVELRAREAVTPEVITTIERAHAQFAEELGLTQMSVSKRD
jgi:predicted transcriptional regulator